MKEKQEIQAIFTIKYTLAGTTQQHLDRRWDGDGNTGTSLFRYIKEKLDGDQLDTITDWDIRPKLISVIQDGELPQRGTPAAFVVALQIMEKCKPGIMGSGIFFGTSSDSSDLPNQSNYITFDVYKDEIAPDSDDGIKLRRLGCSIHDGQWEWRTS